MYQILIIFSPFPSSSQIVPTSLSTWLHVLSSLIFPSQQASIENSFLIRDGTSCPLALSRLGCLCGLDPCMCLWTLSIWEFIRALVLLCLESAVPWSHPPTTSSFFNLSPFLPHNSLSLGVRDVDKYTPLGLCATKSFTLYTLSVALCLNSSLLQEQASLMRAEWCTDQWVQHCVIRSHFTAMLL